MQISAKRGEHPLFCLTKQNEANEADIDKEKETDKEKDIEIEKDRGIDKDNDNDNVKEKEDVLKNRWQQLLLLKDINLR